MPLWLPTVLHDQGAIAAQKKTEGVLHAPCSYKPITASLSLGKGQNDWHQNQDTTQLSITQPSA